MLFRALLVFFFLKEGHHQKKNEKEHTMATTSDDDATPLLDIEMPPLLPASGAARYLCVTPPTHSLDSSLFVAAPPVDLFCPICKHVPWRNTVSCTNGHLYCKECLQAWKNRIPAGKCPQCEVRLDVMVPCRGVEATLTISAGMRSL